MELKELLDAEGVDSLDDFKKKIRTQQKEADSKILKEKDEQIMGLEEIKKTHVEKLAEQGRSIELLSAAKEETLNTEKKTEDDQVQLPQVNTQLIEQNEELKASLSDEDDAKLVEAYQGLDPATQKVIDSSPEGFSAFARETLGITKAPHQKTFRPPAKQVELSAEEKVLVALGKIKPDTTPRLRPNGIGFSASEQKPKARTAPQISRNMGLLDVINAQKQNQ